LGNDYSKLGSAIKRFASIIEIKSGFSSNFTSSEKSSSYNKDIKNTLFRKS